MSSLNLRLLAMAVILIGGLAGVLPPLMGKWMASPDSITSRAVRAFSGGTILGVALVSALQQTHKPMKLFSLQHCVQLSASSLLCAAAAATAARLQSFGQATCITSCACSNCSSLQ
jgi:hypothetical protein